MSTGKPIVLFVDDEPSVLEGFMLTQGKQYDVRSASSGAGGLEVLSAEPGVAIVVSDMRMPEMDGAAFLAQVRERAPDAVRLLLTGHADMDAAARAVNEGRIFRFLTKPCSPDDIRAALTDALQMHELITAERVLLQKTLVGSVKAVVNVLGLTNPEALGRAVRIKNRTRQAADKLNIDDRWGIEFAALFSQIAAASLPEDVSRKLYGGGKLSAKEQEGLIESMKAINEILASIPRLEPVTRTLDELISLTRGHQIGGDGASRAAPDARLLHAIIDIEALEASGQSFSQAVELLLQNEETYGRDTLMALNELARTTPQADVAACAIDSIADGMVLAEDLKTTDGLLLLPRGFEFSQSSRNHIVYRFKHRLPARVKVYIAPQPDQEIALRNAS